MIYVNNLVCHVISSFIDFFSRRSTGFQTSAADPGFKKREFYGILPGKILKFQVLGKVIPAILRQSQRVLISRILKVIVINLVMSF